MAIIAKASSGSYMPAPAGVWPGVCVDVVDLGEMVQEFGGKKKTLHKIRIVWQIDQARPDNKPHQASKMYTLSLHEKATLRKDLESWRGRAFSEAELQGFDVETVLSVACLLNIVEASRNGKQYANVMGVMRLPKTMQAPTPRDYVRVCDRQPEDGSMVDNPPTDWDLGITDDDVPF